MAAVIWAELLVFLLCMAPTDKAAGFNLGAPYSTCWTRYPKHEGTGAQETDSPYVITLNPSTYRPGQDILVTISEPNRRRFSGLEIGAFRKNGNAEEIVGRFTEYPPEKMKVFTCFGGFQNMATHKTNAQVQELKLTWKAPDRNVGNIIFKSTVVENFTSFWINVHAELHPENINLQEEPPVYPPINWGPLVEAVDMSSCGDTKGCFLYPRHCTDNCIAALSYVYRPDTDDFVFEMTSNAAKNYVSVGFSDDGIMGNEETITCVNAEEVSGVQHGYNPAYYNERLLTRFLSDVEVKQADGRLQCRFVLPRKTEIYRIDQGSASQSYSNFTVDKAKTWYIMLAWGKTMPESDTISYHTQSPVISSTMINLKTKSVHTGSIFHLLVRLHGAVMMLAWIFLTGVVTVVSRHYRDWMPRTRWCGTKVWFQIHRELAISVGVLTLLGIVLTFAHFGPTIRKSSVPHSYVGLAVTAGVLLQIFGGIIRPGAESKVRPAFNWVHRSLGQAVHILAAVTIFLAYDISYLSPTLKFNGYVTIGAWVGLQLTWHIIFEIVSVCQQRKESNTKQTGGGKGTAEQTAEKRSPSLQLVLTILYLVSLLAVFLAALIVFLLV